jgi:drug/metabolite transporter (DMT)-like permease
VSRRHLVLVAIGVIAISSSAVLVRVADAPAFAVAFYRCALAALVLVPIGLVRHRDEYRELAPSMWRLAVLAGLFLGGHFATWIPSITLTTVAASVVLVQTQPIWVAMLGPLFGQKMARRALVGVAIALVGTVVISGGDLEAGGDALLGDLLALTGAVLVAAYTMLGRRIRRTVSVVTYTGIAYSVAACVLAAVMLVSGTPFLGYPPETWFVFATITVGPQFLGHTMFNYLLGELSAAVVAVVLMLEPIGASLLAFIFLSEVPPGSTLAGGALILVGVFVAIRAETRDAAAPVG